MINKIKKGYRLEKRCYDELSHYPYRWKTIRHRFLNIDLFELFDVVVADENHVRFIQVKTGYCSKEVIEKIRKCKLPDNCIKEVWEWFRTKKHTGWRKQRI